MKLISGLLSLLAGLGLILGTLTVVNSQKEETTLELSVAGDDVAFIYTAPGVLDLVNEEVTVTMSAPDQTIHWGMASVSDVEGYIGDASSKEITGLTSWEALRVSTNAGTDEANQAIAERGAENRVSIVNSDLWNQSGSGDGEVVETFTPDSDFPHSLIATTTSGVAPEVTLSWVRSHEFGSPVVWYVIGALLTLIGTFLLLNWFQDRGADKENRQRKKEAKEQAKLNAAAETSVLPVYKGNLAAPGTSREIQRTHTDSALGAAILPGSVRSDHFRSRELADEDRVVLPVEDDVDNDDSLDTEAPVAENEVVDIENTDVDDVDPADVETVDEEVVDVDPAEETVVDGDPVESVELDENVETDVVDGESENVDGEPHQPKDDWRSLWNLSWGKSRGKEDETNA